MFVNGRGPMNRGFGPMGGPMHHRPMGCRPMGMGYHPMGFFPMGVLLILPVLMFGGWIGIAVVAGMLNLLGAVIGGIFSGMAWLVSGIFSWRGILPGIVIGLGLYFRMKNRNAAQGEE